MSDRKSPFQMAIFGIFAFFIIIAVFIFAGFGGFGGEQSIGVVEVWGTVDQDIMDDYLTDLNEKDSLAGNIKYIQFFEDEIEGEFLDALASGAGPDLILLSQDQILRNWSKIGKMSYEIMPHRDFTETYVPEAHLFLSEGGILGIPFYVDPLVLYWNRDIFAQKGFARPPRNWKELITMTPKITERDEQKNIKVATIALGSFDNISHAKDILSTLIMQKGGNIVVRTPDGQLFSALEPQGNGLGGASLSPSQTALRAYTEFANPIKSIYTWNRSLPQSIEMFAQGKLAMYIGYASELGQIQDKNPNLNFDVTTIPQIASGDKKRVMTFGKMYSFVMPRVSQNPYGAQILAFFMGGGLPNQLATPSEDFAAKYHVMSPRVDVLNKQTNDDLQEIFRKSALIADGWLDPHPKKTTQIFRDMIESVTSGRVKLSDAVFRANREIKILIQE